MNNHELFICHDILPPLVNSGADDRISIKATDSTSTSPQTFIVMLNTKVYRWVRVVLSWRNSLLVVRAVRVMAEFLARGAIEIRIGIETFYNDDHSQTTKGASCTQA